MTAANSASPGLRELLGVERLEQLELAALFGRRELGIGQVADARVGRGNAGPANRRALVDGR